jgi:hypothetical protein
MIGSRALLPGPSTIATGAARRAVNAYTGATVEYTGSNPVLTMQRPGGGVGGFSVPGTPGGTSGGLFQGTFDDFLRRLGGRAADWATERLFPSTGGATPGEGSAGSCQQGFQWNPATGQCERVGLIGTGQRLIPGGATGTQADIYGDAVVGSFGIPAIVPAIVGQVSDKNGNTKPIQRCPPGAVLGKDNLCYMKGSIPRQFRKWKPAPRPVMSAKDAKAIRSIGRLQSKVKKLAGDVGFSCRKR